MLNPNIVALVVPEISALIRTDRQTAMPSHADQEYLYFIESLLSTYYIVLFDKPYIPVYSPSFKYGYGCH